MSKNKIFKNYLLAGSVLTGLLISTSAFSQDAQKKEDAKVAASKSNETVVITGSRIKNKEYTSSSPVTVITSEKSTSAGLVTAAEVLQSSSVANGSGQTNSTFTGYVVDGGGGINTVSLRGLGAQRSLVLINGRRVPPSGVGGTVAAADLNILPAASIYRYEILKDGASSVYGSDAVAGVVNAITRKNFDGFEISGAARVTEQGGGENYDVTGIWGKSFDRGNIMISGSASESKALRKKDRPGFNCQEDYITNADGTRADLIDPKTGKYKCWGYTTGGIAIDNTFFRIPRTGSSAFGVPGWFGPVQFADREMNPEITNDITIISPTKRYTIFAQGEYRPASLNGVELYSEILLNRRESQQDNVRYIFPDYHPNSPQNPFGGLGAFVFPYFLTKYSNEQEVDVARGLFGARGNIKNWNWDVYASHSQSSGDYSIDTWNKKRVFWGTGYNEDTGVFTGVCPTGADAGCVMLNQLTPDALNFGKLTPAEDAYFRAKDRGHTKYTQSIFEATITGDLMQLPAGPLGTAFGLSGRRDEINDTPGELSRSGNSYGLASAGITKGSDSLIEAFTEFQVPVVKNKPFFEDLKLNLSGRYSNYDSVGDAFTYKAGVNWALNNTLRLRGTYGTSFRAPGLFELYLNAQTGFLSQRTVDPCINWGAIGDDGQPVKSATIRTNCAAAGIPNNYNGSGSSAQVFYSGSKDLNPEESKAWTVGIALTPPETGFKFAIDFWGIEVNNQIARTGAGVVGACYGQATYPNGFCGLFTRNASYNITLIDASYRNIPSETTEGFDIAASYEKEFNFGKLSSDLDLTYTSNSITTLYPGDKPLDYNGTVGDPKVVADLQTSFTHGSWKVTHTLNYVGSSDQLGYQGENGKVSFSYAPNAFNKTKTEVFITHDITARYTGKDWSSQFGVVNIFGEMAPALGLGNDAGSAGRLGIYAFSSQYGAGYLGRQFYVNFKKQF